LPAGSPKKIGKSSIYRYVRIGMYFQWIGLREILEETPIFNGKIYGFL